MSLRLFWQVNFFVVCHASFFRFAFCFLLCVSSASAVIMGLGIFPNKHMYFDVLRHKILCLLFLSHCRAVFCLSIFPVLRLSLVYSEFFTDILSVILSSRFSVRCFLRINLFYLFSAQLLCSLGGSFMKMELLF